jgi:16S rRNA (guanine(966)-N(2))-methyltransferase RsmD
MRVITGSAKGRHLRAVPGTTTRPITDRVKEALFNILADDVIDARVLDLFAGTGGVGIEALSRGAARAVFVDAERQAVNTILANLKQCGLSERATVVRTDVFQYLGRAPSDAYHYIHVAPPQYQGLWARALALLDAQPAWLHPQGVAVVQIHPKEYAVQTLANLVVVDERRYGSTVLYFYERQGSAEC